MSRATNNKAGQSGASVVQPIEQLRPSEAVEDETMKIENRRRREVWGERREEERKCARTRGVWGEGGKSVGVSYACA